MPRPLRFDPDGGWHHVMNRGADHQPVFFADNDRVAFGQLLGDVHERFGIEVHAYCLMDNHFHLLLHCPTGGLSDAMQRLGSLYTRHVNHRLERDGALFRGRFASRAITDDDYLLTAARYIHRNPLDITGIGAPDEYRWSSHRTYLGHRRRPAWLTIDRILSSFGDDAHAFDRFVQTQPCVEQTSQRLDPHELVRAAGIAIAEAGLDDERTRRALATSITTLALVQGAQTQALDEVLGRQRHDTRRKAISRARRRIADDPALGVVLARTLDLVRMPSAPRDSRGQTPLVPVGTVGV